MEQLDTLIAGKRLKDISDLPLDLCLQLKRTVISGSYICDAGGFTCGRPILRHGCSRHTEVFAGRPFRCKGVIDEIAHQALKR